MIKLVKKYGFILLLLTIILCVIEFPSQLSALESSNDIVINPNTNMIYVTNDNKTVSVIDGNTNEIVDTIAFEKQPEDSFDFGNITDYISVGGTIAAIVTAFIGIRAYKQSQVLKNKDVLKDIFYPLIEEYNDRSRFGIVKDLLDDKSVNSKLTKKILLMIIQNTFTKRIN